MGEERGYRPVLRHPVARGLLLAESISELGDFVGLAALLLLAYHGAALVGSAAVFAIHALPGLAVTLLLAPRLQVWPRRGSLAAISLLGAAVLVLPAVLPSVLTALVAAAALGASRKASVGVAAAVLAEDVPPGVRGSYVAMSGGLNQALQVLGLLVGGGLTLALGPRPALLLDATTFVVAALVLARTPISTAAVTGAPAPPPSLFAGVRAVWERPVLRVLAGVSWAGMLGAVVPEAASPALVSGRWLPVALAAAPAGAAVAAALGARSRTFDDVPRAVRLAALSAVAFVLGGLALLAAAGLPIGSGARGGLVVTVNLVVGATQVWHLAMIAAFISQSPRELTVQVNSFMSWTVSLLAGVGAFVVALLGAGQGYVVVGVVLVVAAGWGARRIRATSGVAAPSGGRGT